MSHTYAEVLILEDDEEQRADLRRLVSELGKLEPLPCPDPDAALRILEASDATGGLLHAPVLALVDLDMGKAQATTTSAYDVLECLYRRHPSCMVLVHSAFVDDINVQRRVNEDHPRALVQSKTFGSASLESRLRSVLTATVGDLRVEGGVVVHLTSRTSAERALRDLEATRQAAEEELRIAQEAVRVAEARLGAANRAVDETQGSSDYVFGHEVAVRLVMAGFEHRNLRLTTEAQVRMVSRFNQWLRAVGSPALVRNVGRGEYYLEAPEGRGD